MKIELSGKKIGLIASAFIFSSLLMWRGTVGDGLATVLAFIDELATFTLQALLVVSVSMALVYFTAAIRSCEWFDKNGAGTEMADIRDRVGTPKEKEGDNKACGLQYLSSTILIAIMIISFFMIHGA